MNVHETEGGIHWMPVWPSSLVRSIPFVEVSLMKANRTEPFVGWPQEKVRIDAHSQLESGTHRKLYKNPSGSKEFDSVEETLGLRGKEK